MSPENGRFSRKPGQAAEAVSFSCARAAGSAGKQASSPCISASDASNDHKPCFLLRAGVARENEEKVPEGAGFSDQLSFHFN